MRQPTPIPVHERDWLTSNEVMMIFQVSRWSTLKNCKKGRLEAYRQEKDQKRRRYESGEQYARWQIPKYAVRELLDARRTSLLARLKVLDDGLKLLEAMDWPFDAE